MRLGHLAMATLGVTVPAGLFMVVANPSPDPTVGWNIVVSLVGIGGMVPLIVGQRTIAHGTIGAIDDRVAIQITRPA